MKILIILLLTSLIISQVKSRIEERACIGTFFNTWAVQKAQFGT